MIRKNPMKDVEHPPGQVVPTGPDTLKHNIEQWEKYQQSRKDVLSATMCVKCGNKYYGEFPDDCLFCGKE